MLEYTLTHENAKIYRDHRGGKDGYYAYCPELKGCQTQGQGVDEALANLREATELYLETLSAEELESLASSTKTILSTSLEVVHA